MPPKFEQQQQEFGYDGPKELTELKEEVRDVQGSDSSETIHWYKKSRLREIKEKSLEQNIRIAELLDRLQNLVEEDPDIEKETLFREAETFAMNHSFNRMQLTQVQLGIETYIRRYTTIKKYRGLYPNNSDLFEKCFGFKPKGEIRVQTGPMSFYIQCLNDEDYAEAYAHDVDSKSKGYETEKDKALKSAGVAFHSIKKEPELNKMVALERSSLLLEEKQTSEQIVTTENKKTFSLPLNEYPILFLGTPNYPEWLITSENNSFRAINTKDHRNNIELDLTKAQKSSYPLECNGKRFGYITIEIGNDPSKQRRFQVTNTTDEVFNITHYASGRKTQIDTDRSQKIKEHEEQHLLNSIFIPDENAKKMSHPDSLPDDLYAYRKIKDIRKSLIDSLARDEILAYYTDKNRVSSIEYYLLKSELYDYKKRYKSTIDTLIKASPELKKLPETEIELLCKIIFTEEYERDLKRWLKAMKNLEQKNYTQKEILSLLYQEPLAGWIRLARRLPNKSRFKK